MTTTRLPLIDDNASRCIYCKGTRAQYTCSRTVAKKKCLNLGCRQSNEVDVAYEVHKKITTVDGFREWWEKYDNG